MGWMGAAFILRNKKLMQAHVDGAGLGKSPIWAWEYFVWQWRVPFVRTVALAKTPPGDSEPEGKG